MVLVAVVAAGCGGLAGTGELRSDQAPAMPADAGDTGPETADMIVNDAVRGGIHPSESSAAPGGSLSTAPGAPDAPSREATKTWATTPGTDPSSPTGSTEKLTPVPKEVPAMKGPGARPYGEDLGDLAQANAAFAFDLYRELSATDGNLFFSPHSIAVALAMTYAGARGDTESAMADTLRFPLPPERLHGAFRALAHDLYARSAGEDEGGSG